MTNEERRNEEVFQKQCEELDTTIDNLSDWEKDFYTWRLLQRLLLTRQREKENTTNAHELYYLRDCVRVLEMETDMFLDKLF